MKPTPEYYTEDEVARILRTTVRKLRGRRATGTGHPPFKEICRGHVLFEKNLFHKWLDAGGTIWEVKALKNVG